MTTDHRHPYVGEGADGARRSAEIDRTEAETYDRATQADRITACLESAARWEQQAEDLEAQEQTVAVRDLHVQCSLRVRNFDAPGVAMSDCCGRSAGSAVEYPDGRKMWRCGEHEGLIDVRTGARGPVLSAIVRRVDKTSSASVQHYIDTGRYLTASEAAEYATRAPAMRLTAKQRAALEAVRDGRVTYGDLYPKRTEPLVRGAQRRHDAGERRKAISGFDAGPVTVSRHAFAAYDFLVDGVEPYRQDKNTWSSLSERELIDARPNEDGTHRVVTLTDAGREALK